MRFRFTLSHAPDSLIELPALSLWQNVGSGTSWTIDSDPDVAFASGSSKFLATAFNPVLDRVYRLDVRVDMLVNIGGNYAAVVGFVKDGAFVGTTYTLSTTTTTAWVSAQIYTNTDADYVGIQLTGSGSFSALTIEGVRATDSATSLVINEPDGWKDSILKLERHDEFHMLIEHFQGNANGAFIFYGNNGFENGGIDYIKNIEQTYGVDAELGILIEIAYDDVTYQEIWDGLLALETINELTGNKLQCGIQRDDFWAKFISRLDTPVDLLSTTDLDGTAIPVYDPVNLNLVTQKLTQNFVGFLPQQYYNFTSGIAANNYVQLDFDGSAPVISATQQAEVKSEIEEKSPLPIIDNPTLPVWLWELKYPGDLQVNLTILLEEWPNGVSPVDTDLKIYLQHGSTQIQLTRTDYLASDGLQTISRYQYSGTIPALAVDSRIRLYIYNDSGSASGNFFIRFDDQVQLNVPPTYVTKASLSHHTTYPETRAQGFFVHDTAFHICQRILGEQYDGPFFSNYLGGLLTQTRFYASTGCGWAYMLLKGLQIRGYTLTEKPFFMSFKKWWDGIDPILNLCLFESNTDDSPGSRIIRVEEKSYAYNQTTSVNFSNVQSITRSYDKNLIFNKVSVGYNKWESETTSGIDDPQSKREYSTRLQRVGKEMNIESSFMAASLAIESTRRAKVEKSADYKFDNDTFIIAVNDNDVSPDRYEPEFSENFDSITGLLNEDFRYNLRLTPARNLLRWINVLNGCLQTYLPTNFKFVSGEGNYDMTSEMVDENCLGDNNGDSLDEGGNIPASTDYLHLPMLYDIEIPMDLDEYNTINVNKEKAIGISQTTSGHVPFFIKSLDFYPIKGRAVIQAWPKTYFDIQVIQGGYNNPGCPIEPSVSSDPDAGSAFDEDYQAVLDYLTEQGISLPSDAQQQLDNQKVLNLKSIGAWDELDLLYVPEYTHDRERVMARVNWKSPGNYTLTEVGTLTYSSTGFAGNGTNSYLRTGWTPSVNAVKYTQNNAGAFVKINNNIGGSGGCAFGCRHSSSNELLFQPRNVSNANQYSVNNADQAGAAATTTLGFHHIKRTSSSDVSIFRDGLLTDSDTVTSQTIPQAELILSALMLQTGLPGAGTYSAARIGVFGIGASLNGLEDELYTVFN